MKKVIIVFFILVAIAGFAWTLLFLYNKSQEKPIVFDTETAVMGNIIQKTVATGSVVPRNEILIKPQISGIIEELMVEAGDQVKSGDVLARIKIIPNMVSLSQAENRLNRAKIQLESAQIEFDRNKKLYESGVVAYADYLPFNITLKNAAEELKGAEDNLQIVKQGVSKSSGIGSNTLIRSTVDGMVLDVPVKKGNSVIEANNFNEGTTIASIANMNDLIFEGKVDESEVGKIKEGMDLIMSIGAIDGEKFSATLEYIAPKGVEENGAIQFFIRAAVTLKSDQFIRAGYSANADVVLARRDSVLTLNEGVIQYDKDGKPFVEIENGEQKFEKKDITVGLSDGLMTEVLSGVTEQDKIKIWNKPQQR
jgi:HlyD family secretion protein